MNKKIIIILAVLVVMICLGFWLARRNSERVEIPVGPEDSTITVVEQIEPTILDNQIREYLVDYYGQANFGGRVYCDYELFGMEIKDEEVMYYLWALCQEYYIDRNDELKKGMLLQGPIVLIAQIVDGQLVFLSHQSFEQDLDSAKNIFPEIYHQRLQESTERDGRLEMSVQNQAEHELLPGLGK